ncbi:hypothetical protein QBC39DRAFT_340315 [Podospora conica]|nr:hypothetical protein QBC39DRAFT_340315 [Schizothecium conicum]
MTAFSFFRRGVVSRQKTGPGRRTGLVRGSIHLSRVLFRGSGKKRGAGGGWISFHFTFSLIMALHLSRVVGFWFGGPAIWFWVRVRVGRRLELLFCFRFFFAPSPWTRSGEHGFGWVCGLQAVILLGAWAGGAGEMVSGRRRDYPLGTVKDTRRPERGLLDYWRWFLSCPASSGESHIPAPYKTDGP